MYGLGWFQKIFTTRTSVSMDIEQQTKRMMSRHGEKWPCSLLLQENGCSGGKKKLKSTESVHCTFSMHFFEVCSGSDLHKWREWLYSKEYLVFVDRGQERVRKSEPLVERSSVCRHSKSHQAEKHRWWSLRQKLVHQLVRAEALQWRLLTSLLRYIARLPLAFIFRM